MDEVAASSKMSLSFKLLSDNVNWNSCMTQAKSIRTLWAVVEQGEHQDLVYTNQDKFGNASLTPVLSSVLTKTPLKALSGVVYPD